MSFGHFDDAQREYVITRPDTPLPWINYLGNEAYFGIISNTAGGYSFYKDARLRRLTRYRYNNAPRDIGGRYLYLRDNAVAGSNLLEAASLQGVKRFILSSTANLFDDPAKIPIVAEERIVPGSPYGESKYFIERYLHWMERIYGMAYCCLRYFNASGAHPNGHIGEDHTPEYHLIPIILQVALGQREKLTIFGEDYPTADGTCIRDYIHVIDLAEAHILALEALADGKSRKYNLGNGKGYSIMEVLNAAREITGQTIPAVKSARRAGDPATLIADSTRIQQELGWQPEFGDLRQIIQTAWNWHQSHPQGYATKK